MLTIYDILAGLMFTEIPGEDPDNESEGSGTPTGDDRTVPIADLNKANAEAAGWRKKLRDMETSVEKMKADAAKTKKDAELAELEGVAKAEKIAADAQAEAELAKQTAANAQAKMDLMAKKQAVFAAANAAGFHHPGDAALHINLDEVEMVDGIVDLEKTTELIHKLAEGRADLLSEPGAAPGDFGPTNPPGPKVPGAKPTKQATIEKMKAEAKELMSQGKIDKALMLTEEAFQLEHAP